MNEYHEWGNERYPFQMILDLQKLAIPDSLQTSEGKIALGKTAGYLFWQTSTGFHFKSLDKLFDMRTSLILLITWLFGDAVNPYYLFPLLYGLSFLAIYLFWKKKKKK